MFRLNVRTPQYPANRTIPIHTARLPAPPAFVNNNNNNNNNNYTTTRTCPSAARSTRPSIPCSCNKTQPFPAPRRVKRRARRPWSTSSDNRVQATKRPASSTRRTRIRTRTPTSSGLSTRTRRSLTPSSTQTHRIRHSGSNPPRPSKLIAALSRPCPCSRGSRRLRISIFKRRTWMVNPSRRPQAASRISTNRYQNHLPRPSSAPSSAGPRLQHRRPLPVTTKKKTRRPSRRYPPLRPLRRRNAVDPLPVARPSRLRSREGV